MAMAVDRYVAVTDPLHFNDRVTKRRVLIFILLSWPISIPPPSFYPFATRQNWAVFLLIYSHTYFTVPGFVLLSVYSRIFRSLIRRRCELVSLATSVSTMTLRHTLERERKMALTTFIVLCVVPASVHKDSTFNFLQMFRFHVILQISFHHPHVSVLLCSIGSIYLRLEGAKISTIFKNVRSI